MLCLLLLPNIYWCFFLFYSILLAISIVGVFAWGRGRQWVSLVSIIKWFSLLIESVRRGVELSKCYCPRQFPLVAPHIPELLHGDFNCEADHVVVAVGLGWHWPSGCWAFNYFSYQNVQAGKPGGIQNLQYAQNVFHVFMWRISNLSPANGKLKFLFAYLSAWNRCPQFEMCQTMRIIWEIEKSTWIALRYVAMPAKF